MYFLKIAIMDHWIIRVGDGENFRNSKYPIWGLKKGNGSVEGIVKKIKRGDILWFLTSKKYGGILIGMAKFIDYNNRKNEPLVNINTVSNKDQNWKGDEEWDIQIKYGNLYEIEKQEIKLCIQCSAIIMNYKNFKSKIDEDLNMHYRNFLFYSKESARFTAYSYPDYRRPIILRP